jgi:hypothetical protein
MHSECAVSAFLCCLFTSVQDPFAALVTALDPSVIRPIDVAAVNEKFFVNIAVAGSIAEVSPEELASKWKRLLGPVAIGFHGGCQIRHMLKFFCCLKVLCGYLLGPVAIGFHGGCRT